MFRSAYNFRWAFFPAGSAILLDMMYKFNDPRYELGGLAAYELFTIGTNATEREERLMERKSKRHEMSRRTKDVGLSNGDVLAVHTTCYEQGSKILGLKAANAFWNPYYYTANRRTLTKPLLYITEEQLRHEVRTLLYLAHVTNRSLIIPNILGNGERLVDLDTYRERTLWPGFRVLHQRKLDSKHNVKILEAAYYWRVQRDYFAGSASKLIPDPVVVPLFRNDPAFLVKHNRIPDYHRDRKKPQRNDLSISDIEAILQLKEYRDQPRIVLSAIERRHLPTDRDRRKRYLHDYQLHVGQWAKDSVGDYNSFDEELIPYGELPRLTDAKASEGIIDPKTSRWIIDNTRLCIGMFEFDRGNRSCFDKCK